MKEIRDESFFLRAVRLLGGFVIFLAVFVVVSFFWLFPFYPRTAKGWLMLFLFGIPLYLAGQAFFDWAFSKKMGERISKRKFSLARISLALVIVLMTYGILFLVYVLFLRNLIGKVG